MTTQTHHHSEHASTAAGDCVSEREAGCFVEEARDLVQNSPARPRAPEVTLHVLTAGNSLSCFTLHWWRGCVNQISRSLLH